MGLRYEPVGWVHVFSPYWFIKLQISNKLKWFQRQIVDNVYLSNFSKDTTNFDSESKYRGKKILKKRR